MQAKFYFAPDKNCSIKTEKHIKREKSSHKFLQPDRQLFDTISS